MLPCSEPLTGRPPPLPCTSPHRLLFPSVLLNHLFPPCKTNRSSPKHSSCHLPPVSPRLARITLHPRDQVQTPPALVSSSVHDLAPAAPPACFLSLPPLHSSSIPVGPRETTAPVSLQQGWSCLHHPFLPFYHCANQIVAFSGSLFPRLPAKS